MFCIFVIAACLFPLWFTAYILYERETKKWSWIDRDARQMYSDAAKAIVTGAGIAVAILLNALGKDHPQVTTLSRWAIYTLIVCIISATLTLLALARGYERARSRHVSQGGEGDQGYLSRPELLLILIPGYFTLTGFLLGFVLLGRIASKL